MRNRVLRIGPEECVGIRASARGVLLCSKIPRLRSQPGNMTTPWKYTGQSVPRGKQHAGAAAPEHPARVVSDLVTISPMSRIDKDAQAAIASAQTMAKGFKERATKGGTPKQLWPSTDSSVERQLEVHAASTPVRIKADRTGSRALAQNTRFQDTLVENNDAPRKMKEPSGSAATRKSRGHVERRGNLSTPPNKTNGGTNNNGGDYQMTTHFLALTYNAGLVVGLTVMLKELLLPKMNVYMPAIMCYVKALMHTLRAAMTRSVEHGTRLVGGHPKFASAYAMILLVASASRLTNELQFLARLIAHASTAILKIHGIPVNALRMISASDDADTDDASDSGSQPPTPTTSDARRRST